VGLGDALNDLPLLEAVDRPIVVPRRDSTVDPELARALPRAELAPAPGPVGWNAAVMIVLAGGTLPAVSGGDAA
jgi:mannosyl-3-phosphoglycerate phosphatase